MSRATRLVAHSAVSTSLALCSDHELRELVDTATPIGSGIGGTAALLEIDGTPVFVKQVPLTDLERLPENLHSTANLFGLPTFLHYGIGQNGIGGPGSGVWRELAVHTMTTNWVLAGDYDGFPLMHHWRVLPSPGQPLPEELADVEQAVASWGGGSEVRRRIEALRDSSATVALFLEYIPQTLHEWLSDQIALGGDVAERACVMVEKELEAGTSFMNSQGLLHFDVHFKNILTDGQSLYFADYGLALSSRFELTPDETEFFDQHRTYDRGYSVAYLVNWLAVALYGFELDRREFIRECAKGQLRAAADLPPAIAAALVRYAPIADVIGDFHRELQRECGVTTYPLEAIRRIEELDGPALA